MNEILMQYIPNYRFQNNILKVEINPESINFPGLIRCGENYHFTHFIVTRTALQNVLFAL